MVGRRKGERSSVGAGSSFLRRVCDLVEASTRGEYFRISNQKNSRGFYVAAPETDRWCREVERLGKEGTRLSRKGLHVEAAAGLELLLDLLIRSEDGVHEIVHAEEWGIHWKVGLDFSKVLRAFLRSLYLSTIPEEFARRAQAILTSSTFRRDEPARILRGVVRKKAYQEAVKAHSTSL